MRNWTPILFHHCAKFDRIMPAESIPATDDCVPWPGKFKGGYPDCGGVYAHRVAYTLYYGQIPENYTIDHTCFNKACVNPRHLEAVTAGENIARARRVGLYDAQRKASSESMKRRMADPAYAEKVRRARWQNKRI